MEAAPRPAGPTAPLVLPAAVGGSASLSWQAPAQVKVGEQFSAVLRVNSQTPLRGLPALVGFDPQTLQVVNVREGEFFKQGSAQTTFSQRVDPAQGKIFVALVRQGISATDAGTNGSGGVVTVTFKAVKPAAATRIQLLSATPEPAPAVPVTLPVEHLLRIVP